MKETILEGHGLCKAFPGGGELFHGLDVSVFAGDFTVIMGPSGAGKSTLLYALSGMDSISGGTVDYMGQPVTGLSENKMSELRAKEFGFVFQQTHLVSNLTLLENVTVAGYLAGKEPLKTIQARAEQLLRQMGVEGAKERLPAHVSGGEAQRAAIARAMIGDPGILFADEPTGALNPPEQPGGAGPSHWAEPGGSDHPDGDSRYGGGGAGQPHPLPGGRENFGRADPAPLRKAGPKAGRAGQPVAFLLALVRGCGIWNFGHYCGQGSGGTGAGLPEFFC